LLYGLLICGLSRSPARDSTLIAPITPSPLLFDPPKGDMERRVVKKGGWRITFPGS